MSVMVHRTTIFYSLNGIPYHSLLFWWTVVTKLGQVVLAYGRVVNTGHSVTACLGEQKKPALWE